MQIYKRFRQMQEKIQNISPIKQRILYFVDYLNISKREFYQKTGISRGTLESNTGITEETVAKLIATYPKINITWLFSGNGIMYSDSNEKNYNVVEEQQEFYGKKSDIPGTGIPLIEADAFAGSFSGDIQILESQCERYVVPLFNGADFLIPVKGNSMYPKYNSGDIVACKRLKSWSFFQWGKCYVIYTDQGTLIKRIMEGKDDEHVLIVSENESKYKPFQLHRSEIKDVAIVMGVIRLE